MRPERKVKIGSLVWTQSSPGSAWYHGLLAIGDSVMYLLIEDGTATPVREPRTVEVEVRFNHNGYCDLGFVGSQIRDALGTSPHDLDAVKNLILRGTLTEVVE